MICPHCHKAIPRGMSVETLKRAKELKQRKFSLREIEKILWSEGVFVSFATISRALKRESK